MESSVTGDDERRAEIEAATDALLADSGLPRYGGHRATIERRMAIAFEAADRVRDARGDDEGERLREERDHALDDIELLRAVNARLVKELDQARINAACVGEVADQAEAKFRIGCPDCLPGK
jgi:hypothetical protein